MSVDFRHSFCHSKQVLVRYRFIFVGEKNVIDENYVENYSSIKLTLLGTSVRLYQMYVFVVLYYYIINKNKIR